MRIRRLGGLLCGSTQHPDAPAGELVLIHIEGFRHGGGVAAEEVVLQAHDRLVRARVALARAAPEKLAVDALGFVELGKNYMQAAERDDLGRELDIGAASRHVGRHGDAARLAGAGDDVGFLLVLARVQHHVLHAHAIENSTELFRRRYGTRSH